MEYSISPSIIILAALSFLGVYILLPWTDPTFKGPALGAIIGLASGHLNGHQKAEKELATSVAELSKV